MQISELFVLNSAIHCDFFLRNFKASPTLMFNTLKLSEIYKQTFYAC